MSDVQRGPRLLVFVVAYYAESTLRGARAHPGPAPRRLRLRGPGRRRRVRGPHLRASAASTGRPPGDPDDGAAQRVQPGLRRQPEGRLHVRDRARVRLRRHGARRRPVRARGAAAAGRAAAGRPGRRGVRQPHDDDVRRAARAGCRSTSTSGNRILTALQNALLGTHLRVPQRLPRLFRARVAADLRFPLNSNDFHFDTEIIIQLLTAGQRIVELPIPTYYGDEICRVNGHAVRQGRDCWRRCRTSRTAGVLYQRRFEPAATDGQGNSHYDLKLGYPSSHQFALDAVPDGSRVLDIGAGPGGMAQELWSRRAARSRSSTSSRRRTRRATSRCSSRTSNDPLVFDARKYDYLLMLDVIEHLKDPEQFLEQLVDQFDYAPRTLVLTTPNIAFVVQRLMLRFGQFNYGKAGILDRTHTRLFTFRSLRRLLVDAGFRDPARSAGVPAPFPKVLGDGWLGRTAVRRQPAADPAQQDAVLLPDLRGGRVRPQRPLHPRRLAVPQRRCRTRIISGSALGVPQGPQTGGSIAIETAGGSLPGRRPAGQLPDRWAVCGGRCRDGRRRAGRQRLPPSTRVRLAERRGRRRAAGADAAVPPGARDRAGTGRSARRWCSWWRGSSSRWCWHAAGRTDLERHGAGVRRSCWHGCCIGGGGRHPSTASAGAAHCRRFPARDALQSGRLDDPVVAVPAGRRVRLPARLRRSAARGNQPVLDHLSQHLRETRSSTARDWYWTVG